MKMQASSSQIPSPSLGVCYYPEQWAPEKWTADLDAMRELGIRFVRLGEFAWSQLEPNPGEYRFEWMQQLLDFAAQRQLSIVLCTPTATPPKWLVDQMPDMVAVDANGLPRKFGSRRHYCFSHQFYRKECERIVRELARRFGAHSAVAAWQTDNEYGCHNTVLSYSAAALHGFREWLKSKYGSIDQLNRAWGNVFWSMEYRDFQEIELPNLTVTKPDPSHELDFMRFSSDQVKIFNRLQVEVIRQHSPGRTILHNFMGKFQDFDHFALSEDLDAAGWDSYPLGFLSEMKAPDSHKARYLRSGDPDFVGFHHDLYRACGRGRWWVLEQQPGPVNWAAYNPSPYPGMIRFWTHEAFAHGAEVVSYFRWRQAPFAQEQMHAGLNLPNFEPDQAFFEAAQVVQELSGLSLGAVAPAKVALVYDYEAAWTLGIQPQGNNFDYMAVVLSFYRAFRRLGLNVDIISQRASLDPYSVVAIPSLPIVEAEFVEALKRFRGQVLLAPRAGSKTADFQIPQELPPGRLQELIPISVWRVESLPEFAPISVTWNAVLYECHTWLEHVRTNLPPFIRLQNGQGVAYRHGKISYLAVLPGQTLLNAITEELVRSEQLEVEILPNDIRSRARGRLRYYFNYGPEPVILQFPPETRFWLGGPELPVAGVTVVEHEAD
jgi:beta-galactosidase